MPIRVSWRRPNDVSSAERIYRINQVNAAQLLIPLLTQPGANQVTLVGEKQERAAILRQVNARAVLQARDAVRLPDLIACRYVQANQLSGSFCGVHIISLQKRCRGVAQDPLR